MSKNLVSNKRLREVYGFGFPEDLVQMWSYVGKRRPVHPERPFDDVLAFGTQLSLAGPFDLLAADELRSLACSPLVHCRYRYDPPEFFTVFTGDSDGESWGYWFDDPESMVPVVAVYYRSDAYDFTVIGNTLFGALRQHVETCIASEEDAEADDLDAFDPVRIKKLKAFSSQLSRKPGAAGEGAGWHYEGEPSTRIPTAATSEGMGILVPEDSLAPIKIPSQKNPKAVDRAVRSADKKCRDGYPGTALLLGRELWGWQEHGEVAADLLMMAYKGLGRDVLAKVVEAHRSVRWADRILMMV